MRQLGIISIAFLLATTSMLAGEPAGETGETTGVVRLRMGPAVHGFPLADTNGVATVVVKLRDSVLTRKLADDEALWGLGERFDSLNMRGRTMETWIVDAWGGGNRSYICAPFLISSAGYGSSFCTNSSVASA